MFNKKQAARNAVDAVRISDQVNADYGHGSTEAVAALAASVVAEVKAERAGCGPMDYIDAVEGK